MKGEVMSSKLVGMFVIFNKNNDNKINFGHVIVFVTGWKNANLLKEC